MAEPTDGGDTTANDTTAILRTLDVGGLTCFDPKGDPNTLSIRWKRWKRAFNLYLLSRGVTNDNQKKALLLHTGGLELQELYYILVPEEAEQPTNVKDFNASIKLLDDYFTPKANVPFERHLFRQLEQETNETVDQFVCRLRQKATTCEFGNSDEAIRDQLIEKCRSQYIRRKFLEKTGTVTLKTLQDIARAQEAVDVQLKSIEKSMQPSQVNAVTHRKNPNKKGKEKSASQDSRRGGKNQSDTASSGTSKRCFRCNKTGHFARDKNCPAQGTTCNQCGKTGHYAVCCKTKLNGNSQAQKVYQVDQNSSDADHGYAFMIKNSKDNWNGGEVNITVGGVNLNSVLIDSGASCNLMDSATWNMMKKKGILCESKKSDKKLFAYGQEKAIETLGTFVSEIKCNSSGESCIDEFTVVKGSGKTLLGKATATKLNVLRVGPPIYSHAYSVTAEGNDADIREKFPEIFNGIGKLKNFKLKLHIDQSVKPIAQPVRRLPFGLRDKVNTKLDELLAEDIIEEVPNSPTEWISPLVVIPKSDGDIRVCIDMRRANEAIVRERHPIPTIEEVLYDLNGATVFSKLDLKWGFHQIELDEQSREITTFVTHRGLYRYKRLMFGVNSAPEKYQKIVKDILRGCHGVANIADDLIVYGREIEEHDKNLLAVLKRLRDNGLTLNGKKCQFRLPSLTFFGHDLSTRGITPSEEKVAAIQCADPPQNVLEVRSFLGLVQYSSKFLPDFARVAEPLRMLTRKNQQFVWGSSQEQSFKRLKDLMIKAETLAYFRDECQTRIIADAGPTGIGAVLTQLQDGVWRVISYASRNLSDVERRYSQTEKEALALVWSCERFNLYVYGRDFELETDHKPLECIYSKTSKPSARIERWVLRLQGYNYTVVYRPGKTNIADALSRLNCTNSKDISGYKTDFVRAIVQESIPVALTPKQVELASENDAELTSVRHYIQTGNWSECKIPSFLCVKNELCVFGKLVMRGTRIVIPQCLRKEVLQLAHEGHQGIVKMKNRLRTKVWWPKMDSDAEKVCKSCHGCQVVGEFCKPEPMQRVEPPSGPWQDLALDMLGPMPTGENLLVIVDYYSRFFEVEIMRSTTSRKLIDVLVPIFARYGYPFTLKTDNGPQLVSEEFEKFLSDHGIEHRTSPPLWPQANGEVERQNRTLLKTLKVAEVEGKCWRDELQGFLLAYRTTPQTVTGVTPACLMFGRELKTKLPELRREKDITSESTRDRDWNKKLSGKLYADNKRGAVNNPGMPGDPVLLKNTQVLGKLASNFESQPYIVETKEGAEVSVRSSEETVYRRHL